MIRLRSSRRHRALDHVQSAHLPRIGIAPFRKITCVAREARKSRVKKISVQREDHVCGVEVVDRLDWLAESHLRARVHVVAIDRLIHMPLGLLIELKNRPQLIVQRWRGNCLREYANSCTLQSFLNVQRPANRIQKVTPGSHVAEIGHGLRPIRIVEPENRSLREDISAAETCRMFGIPFDLCRSIKMTLNQQRARISAQAESCGKK